MRALRWLVLMALVASLADRGLILFGLFLVPPIWLAVSASRGQWEITVSAFGGGFLSGVLGLALLIFWHEHSSDLLIALYYALWIFIQAEAALSVQPRATTRWPTLFGVALAHLIWWFWAYFFVGVFLREITPEGIFVLGLIFIVFPASISGAAGAGFAAKRSRP